MGSFTISCIRLDVRICFAKSLSALSLTIPADRRAWVKYMVCDQYNPGLIPFAERNLGRLSRLCGYTAVWDVLSMDLQGLNNISQYAVIYSFLSRKA